MYFIPDVLSFCIASVSIFITISCSGLVTLSTQLWREVSLLSRLLYKYNAHSALSLNRLRKLCWHPSSGRFGTSDTHWECSVYNIYYLYSKCRKAEECSLYNVYYLYSKCRKAEESSLYNVYYLYSEYKNTVCRVAVMRCKNEYWMNLSI